MQKLWAYVTLHDQPVPGVRLSSVRLPRRITVADDQVRATVPFDLTRGAVRNLLWNYPRPQFCIATRMRAYIPLTVHFVVVRQ